MDAQTTERRETNTMTPRQAGTSKKSDNGKKSDVWNPFKFLRKSPEERRSDPSSGMATAGSNFPAAFDSSRLFPTDPMRLMQDLWRDPFSGFGALDRWFGDFSPTVVQPKIDVVDEGDAVRINAELPGIDQKDIEILIEDDVVILRGEKKMESESEEKGCYRIERSFGSFQRVIPLPDGVDINRAEASMDKAVLKMRIPKTTSEKSGAQRVEIK